jgi:hypothetical protein
MTTTLAHVCETEGLQIYMQNLTRYSTDDLRNILIQVIKLNEYQGTKLTYDCVNAIEPVIGFIEFASHSSKKDPSFIDSTESDVFLFKLNKYERMLDPMHKLYHDGSDEQMVTMPHHAVTALIDQLDNLYEVSENRVDYSKLSCTLRSSRTWDPDVARKAQNWKKSSLKTAQIFKVGSTLNRLNLDILFAIQQIDKMIVDFSYYGMNPDVLNEFKRAAASSSACLAPLRERTLAEIRKIREGFDNE